LSCQRKPTAAAMAIMARPASTLSRYAVNARAWPSAMGTPVGATGVGGLSEKAAHIISSSGASVCKTACPRKAFSPTAGQREEKMSLLPFPSYRGSRPRE
jgi:hypothetical protein